MNRIKIENRTIGPEYPPLVIAEIGINHEGSREKAERMIRDAAMARCECVKFQCHVIEDEMIPNNIIPGNAKESIWDIMNRCQLSLEDDMYLKQLTESLGMIYLSTPFSRAAAVRLEKMGVCAYKIGSGECNNYPLIEHIISYAKPLIISTGMNDLEVIKKVVEMCEEAKIDYALLHCTSIYPTPYNRVRLGAITEMMREFPNAIIGLSDHSIGNWTCFGAVALGASILEKHFTSDLQWPGPDIEISITPEDLNELISGGKAIWEARGGNKSILIEERPTIDFAYASVVTICPIKKGDRFTGNNLWVKRPGTGEILAKDYKSLLGKTARKDLPIGFQLKWEDVQ